MLFLALFKVIKMNFKRGEMMEKKKRLARKLMGTLSSVVLISVLRSNQKENIENKNHHFAKFD